MTILTWSCRVLLPEHCHPGIFPTLSAAMALPDDEIFSVEGIEVIQKKITSINDAHANYIGLNPSSTILPKGYKKDPSRRAFETTTIWERDIEVPMRDGVILFADVFRPAEASEKVPVLLVWSPYGKSGTGFLSLDVVPGRVGVPESALSGLESFEAVSRLFPHSFVLSTRSHLMEICSRTLPSGLRTGTLSLMSMLGA